MTLREGAGAGLGARGGEIPVASAGMTGGAGGDGGGERGDGGVGVERWGRSLVLSVASAGVMGWGRVVGLLRGGEVGAGFRAELGEIPVASAGMTEKGSAGVTGAGAWGGGGALSVPAVMRGGCPHRAALATCA